MQTEATEAISKPKWNLFDWIANSLQHKKELRMLQKYIEARNELLRKDWVTVKTINATWIDDYDEVTGRITFVLQENGLGERKTSHTTTKYVSKYTKDDSLRHSTYAEVVYPWRMGQNFAGIPSYRDFRKFPI